MNKTKKAIKARKAPVSLFGINDCHTPKKSRKNTLNNKAKLILNY